MASCSVRCAFADRTKSSAYSALSLPELLLSDRLLLLKREWVGLVERDLTQEYCLSLVLMKKV